MSQHPSSTLSAADLSVILEVTRRLATPFDLTTMLREVTGAARQVLRAERSSVWLHDSARAELVLRIASDISDVRVPIGVGMVGACARERQLINIPDCYADPRFDPQTDRRSGFRTRCALTLPLIDHEDRLIGVMQVLNREGGVFEVEDEALAQALAAQCALALQRVHMTEALLEAQRLRQELEMARTVQEATLPTQMPQLAGYDVHGCFRPASQTGGDTFDLALLNDEGAAAQRLLVVLGDATGHGIGPALSVTQMHAMLRMALRLGSSLQAACGQLNNQLAETLADDRFITAFIGVLDTARHTLHYVCAGQGPVLHWHAASRTFESCAPTTFPLGAMADDAPPEVAHLQLKPGDMLVLLSDGIYEQPAGDGSLFGEERVQAIVAAHGQASMSALAERLLGDVQAFAGSEPQADDVTLVLLRRRSAHQRRFKRQLQALPEVFAFSAWSLAELALDGGFSPTLDFVLEELFTNLIKYSDSEHDVTVEIRHTNEGDEGVEVVIDDEGVDAFDITRQPEVDVGQPLEAREPGGLGLHLVRRMVDSLEYHHDASTRRARIVFRKHRP